MYLPVHVTELRVKKTANLMIRTFYCVNIKEKVPVLKLIKVSSDSLPFLGDTSEELVHPDLLL